MDIDNIVNSLSEAESKEALKYFLKSYTSPAFGALPKNEVELIVLNVLEKVNAIEANPEVYELVSKLRVTRSKARGLIYDRELRSSSTEDLDEKVKELLKSPLIQQDGKLFILEVENPLVSDHLRNKVQKLGYVSDGSFSPNIIKLGLEAISALAEAFVSDENKEELKRVMVVAGAIAPDTSFKGVLKGMLKKVGRKVASDSGDALAEKASDYLGPLFDSALNAVTDKTTALFAE
jgi:hypothetical protein